MQEVKTNIFSFINFSGALCKIRFTTYYSKEYMHFNKIDYDIFSRMNGKNLSVLWRKAEGGHPTLVEIISL